jgi:hypothetical protein
VIRSRRTLCETDNASAFGWIIKFEPHGWGCMISR